MAEECSHLEHRGDVGRQFVLVLLDPPLDRVHHLARVVRQHERAVGALLRLDVRLVLRLRERRVVVLEHARVLPRPGGAALVQQAEDADGALGDQVEDRLVVLVRDKVPLDLLAHVHLLLELEDCGAGGAGVRGGGGG